MEKLLLLLLPLSFGMGLLSPGAAVSPAPGTPVTTVRDPRITEASGLVALPDGLLVMQNDSGDSARVFVVDPATGRTVGVTRWQGRNVDDEAVAPAGPAGSGEVWVGDIGDNTASRTSIKVTRVPVGRGDRTVRAPQYELVYPDGAHDAETLLADPATGRLYVVAKEFFGRVYAAPERLDPNGPNRLTEIGRVLGIATDGAFWPGGRYVVIRNYGQAAFYTWPGLQRVTTIDLPEQKQGEGLAVTADGQLLIGSEGVDQPVLRVMLPDDLRARLDAVPSATAGVDPRTTAPSVPGADQAPTSSSAVPGVWLWGGGAVVAMVALVLGALRRRRRG